MEVESFNFTSYFDSFGGGECRSCGNGVAYGYGLGYTGGGVGCPRLFWGGYGDGYGDGHGEEDGNGYGDGDGVCESFGDGDGDDDDSGN